MIRRSRLVFDFALKRCVTINSLNLRENYQQTNDFKWDLLDHFLQPASYWALQGMFELIRLRTVSSYRRAIVAGQSGS